MVFLLQIVCRYDVLLIQEIVDAAGKAVGELLEAVNDVADVSYAVEVSPRIGRGKAKEQYAFFYRKNRCVESYWEPLARTSFQDMKLFQLTKRPM